MLDYISTSIPIFLRFNDYSAINIIMQKVRIFKILCIPLSFLTVSPAHLSRLSFLPEERNRFFFVVVSSLSSEARRKEGSASHYLPIKLPSSPFPGGRFLGFSPSRFSWRWKGNGDSIFEARPRYRARLGPMGWGQGGLCQFTSQYYRQASLFPIQGAKMNSLSGSNFKCNISSSLPPS